MKRKLRIVMTVLSVLLLGVEILIGMFAHGWVRDYLGDVLVVILLYTICRSISPMKPVYGWILPAGILIFAFCVEFLQLWGFADKMHITNQLVRIIIGTGFSVVDLIAYAIGILPCFIYERITRRAVPAPISESLPDKDEKTGGF